ncbi:class I SAM-dependent methyltransferase [Bacillus suaedae]|uniref:Class I SAM-dependent methyltransferase n=1 Tax=Halalkalibacter suaedae TaxID=2822140 RepID=A0A941AMZ4_9BACI|nr:class I SAM-dependent methyltransferase [Bacillus suaedae]MBP3949767.1 class I SAM-dependent methyltransferase [Bacillus suaedae]
MQKTEIERLFSYLDETATYLEKNWTSTYLEGLAEAGENLFQKDVCQPLTDEKVKALADFLEDVSSDSEYEPEDIRKAYQLAVLKGMKGAVQSHHSMTPDAVCLFLSYLVNKVIHKKEVVTLLDLAVGSGNLVSALLNHSTTKMVAKGFEVDETLVKLAFVNANLQKHELDLFHQDSIEPLAIPEVDLVVTDLPVGFYPKDDVASSYNLNAAEGHSFIHHLMIEQALKKTKDGGFLFFVVPNFLFESEQAQSLHQFIKKEATILGLLKLPDSMFQAEQHGKSIFMLQKKGSDIIQPQQALLAELPSFSKKEALADMIQQINKWFSSELGIM